MKKILSLFIILTSIVALLVSNAKVAAVGYWDVWVTPYSWDPGLYAVVGNIGSDTHAWGMRKTAGAWGTGPVNYQTGSTSTNRLSAEGILSIDLDATYCPGGKCSYGAGSGYKAFVQLWNDPQNYIAIGLIHDPGVSPSGTTLMVEGAAYGKPIGGYWAKGSVTGTHHNLYIVWSADTLNVSLDNQSNTLVYHIATSNPSVSFLGAARNTGDIVDVTFTEKAYTSAMFASYPYTLVW